MQQATSNRIGWGLTGLVALVWAMDAGMKLANLAPVAETLGPLLEWIVGHLHEDLDVESLARRSLMSPRTFARRFRAETGATPHSWVTRQRVQRAEELLEQSDRSIEWIALLALLLVRVSSMVSPCLTRSIGPGTFLSKVQ